MGRMTVDHQKCLSAPSFHEILQKCDEGFRIQLASVGGCPKFSTRVDRADHIEALPLTGGYHLGRFPLQPISAAQGGIRLKSRLVQKENLGPQPFGSPLERRIGLLEPELHRLRIPLVRSTQRLLRSYSISRLASNRPTEVKPSSTLILSLIKACTILRLHKPKSKPYWRGSFPKIQRLTCCRCFSLSLGSGPAAIRSTRASQPSCSNFRSQG